MRADGCLSDSDAAQTVTIPTLASSLSGVRRSDPFLRPGRPSRRRLALIKVVRSVVGWLSACWNSGGPKPHRRPSVNLTAADQWREVSLVIDARSCVFVLCFHASAPVFIRVCVCVCDRAPGLAAAAQRGGVKKVSKIHFFSSREGSCYFSWL